MITKKIKRKINNLIFSQKHEYYRRYKKYAFSGIDCKNISQYEAVITRLYHTIEKGLTFQNFRAGFGRQNIDFLIQTLERYAIQGYNLEAAFYKTALSALNEYLKKNKLYGWSDSELENQIRNLKGEANQEGGAFHFIPAAVDDLEKMNYEQLVKNRHSIRHFDSSPVDVNIVKKAIELAQYTPSACNRQGWRTRIIANKKMIQEVLLNQNGNRGFSDEIDKLLLITSDLFYFNRDRELFQAFIDGGMYAENIINALHFYHLGSIPLSASLSTTQENNIRKILKISDNEILILFVGVGNYPTECITTKSTRKSPKIDVI